MSLDLDLQPPLVSVFHVADDRPEFLRYLTYLHEQGLRPSRDAWLTQVAVGLTELESADVTAPTYVDELWTLERRRLLVVLTWPYAHGEVAPRFPFPITEPAGEQSGISGVYGRTYRMLWEDVRTNLESLVMLAKWGSWDVFAQQWRLVRDVLCESARLGLLVTPLGQSVKADVVDALRSQQRDRAARSREGFVLTWWDIVAIAESSGFSFEPLDLSDIRQKRKFGRDGRYLWNRSEMVQRITESIYTDRLTHRETARVQAAVDAMMTPEFGPPALHRRITADDRIRPPEPGSKYRVLFEHLDASDLVGKQATVELGREELDELTSRAWSEAPRKLRGARGHSGLPKSALSSAPWWYGPWNPDDADWEARLEAHAESSWLEAIGKKSHTRAWMAAGLRASPAMQRGALVSVRFEAVDGRDLWWLWRDALRDGSFSERVEKSD